MMAGFLAAAGVGRVLGALMGGAVWQAGGIGFRWDDDIAMQN